MQEAELRLIRRMNNTSQGSVMTFVSGATFGALALALLFLRRSA